MCNVMFLIQEPEDCSSDTVWKNTFWMPSDENQATTIKSRSITLEVSDSFVNLLLATEH